MKKTNPWSITEASIRVRRVVNNYSRRIIFSIQEYLGQVDVTNIPESLKQRLQVLAQKTSYHIDLGRQQHWRKKGKLPPWRHCRVDCPPWDWSSCQHHLVAFWTTFCLDTFLKNEGYLTFLKFLIFHFSEEQQIRKCFQCGKLFCYFKFCVCAVLVELNNSNRKRSEKLIKRLVTNNQKWWDKYSRSCSAAPASAARPGPGPLAIPGVTPVPPETDKYASY